jgi:hypothetical protein
MFTQFQAVTLGSIFLRVKVFAHTNQVFCTCKSLTITSERKFQAITLGSIVLRVNVFALTNQVSCSCNALTMTSAQQKLYTKKNTANIESHQKKIA